MAHPWFGSTTQLVLMFLGLLGGLLLVALGVWLCSPVNLDAADALDDYGIKLVEWERERVTNLAKGIGSTSVGFLTALIAALLKDDIARTVPRLALVGCLLGSLGGLLIALHLTLTARAFAAQRGAGRSQW